MKKGFSLIELLVVIAITAVLLAVALPNYLSARERARDSKKKSDMAQLKNALRLYYNDFQSYPADGNCGAGKLNYISGCGASGTDCCPCDTSLDFASGASCETVYMKKFPSDLGSNVVSYYASEDSNDFCLAATLDNAADSDLASSRTRCATACTSHGANNCSGALSYCVCAD